ncbi:MAG TPA: MTH1187 family thiamine-binding protein [Candidatus Omnitrophica bacterium]|nr:MTH1187 family thiamine-binding protein [Candidatus Omnitrophota bacterium]
MIIAEVSIIPVGTGSPSLSSYIARCIKILQGRNIKFQLTPMGTVIEGEWDEVMTAIRQMQEEIFNHGVLRVVTTIKTDERRDKQSSMQGKLNSVKSKI